MNIGGKLVFRRTLNPNIQTGPIFIKYGSDQNTWIQLDHGTYISSEIGAHVEAISAICSVKAFD